MYVETIYRMGDIIEVKRRSGLLMGAPGRSRAKRRAATKEEVKRQNQKNRGRHLQRLLLSNFKAGDLHIVLQYRKEERPGTYEEALKEIRLFLRRLKAYCKERGHMLKYIAITERGKRRAVLHHHIIVQGIDANGIHTLPAVAKCWRGYTKASVMYEDGEFAQLADYLVKAAGKEEGQGATYIRSRNLIDPEPEKVLKFGKIHDEAPEGFEPIKEGAESISTRYGTYKRFLARKRQGSNHPKQGEKPDLFSKIRGFIKQLKGAIDESAHHISDNTDRKGQGGPRGIHPRNGHRRGDQRRKNPKTSG